VQTTYHSLLLDLAFSAPNISKRVDKLKLTDSALVKLEKWYHEKNNMKLVGAWPENYYQFRNSQKKPSKAQLIILRRFMGHIEKYGKRTARVNWSDGDGKAIIS